MRPHRAAGGGLCLLLAILLCAPAAALETIYLVRHAEKSEGWPQERELDAFWPLSPAGQVRAEFLASRLENAGIAAVYTSRTTRALMTGLPLANRIKVPIAAKEDTEAFLAEIRGKHPNDKAVLIVGHSNTIPTLLIKLGATPDCYGKLGIVKKGQGADQLLLIEGYDGLWKVDLAKQGCEALARE